MELTDFMNEYQWYKNSLPAAEDYVPLQSKKKNKLWLKTIIISAASSAVLIAAFAAFVMPHMKSPTTIHYSSSSSGAADTSSMSEISVISGKCSDSTVYVSSSGNAGGFFTQQIALGDGSGIIISDDGYIVTSSSVVNSGTEITVTLNDGQKLPAIVVGNDQKTDIAVLKIQADGLVPAILGDSQQLKVGEPVITVGNPLAPKLINTVTYGILSGINDNVTLQKGVSMNLLQTDAYIASGNAGGGLFNSNGEAIGVVISNIQTEGGISLAIPINDIKPLLTSFIGVENSETPDTNADTPMIGITATEEQYGVVVETVSENYPAAKAGIKVGDVIIKVDGTPVKTVAKINEIRITHKRGDTMTATVFRDGETLDIQIVLE